MTGGFNGASPCEKGVYLDVKKESSHNATLNDSMVIKNDDSLWAFGLNNMKESALGL